MMRLAGLWAGWEVAERGGEGAKAGPADPAANFAPALAHSRTLPPLNSRPTPATKLTRVHDVLQAGMVVRGCPPLEAVHDVALVQEELGKVGAARGIGERRERAGQGE